MEHDRIALALTIEATLGLRLHLWDLSGQRYLQYFCCLEEDCFDDSVQIFFLHGYCAKHWPKFATHRQADPFSPDTARPRCADVIPQL